ncbi:MAG: hypothetical protein LC117_09340 [Bacteroidia bacterium]|nr:hypothetical protein [Bacteroidia bacterium]MCZ2278116.1 hypothetical protein [Bacteroidia bacterium]
MKKQILLSATITTMTVLLLVSNSSNATVWRVNNNGASYVQWTGQQVFSNFSQAVASASAGDTIHLEASPTAYNGTGIGATHVDKKLIIIGPGYFLGGATGNANQQVNPNTALIMEIFFNAGSDNSEIMGVQIGTGAGILHIRTSNITVKRNYFKGRLYIDNSTPISNILITQNYFEGQDFTHGAGMASVSSSIISNNRIFTLDLTNNFQGIITQNVFDGGGPISFFGNQFYNNIIRNATVNIIANNNDTTNVHNNVFTYAAPPFLLPTPNSNTFSFPLNQLFITSSSVDGNLQDSSACIQCFNNGSFGYIMGVYGGAPGTEYKRSGIPAIPAIYQLYATPNLTRGDTIQVIIHTRSNN